VASSPAQQAPRPKFPVPYGLFIVLAIYAMAVLAYVWSTYWNAPEYNAAKSYAQALTILGVDDGRRCSEEGLTRAFELTLEAARLMPDERVLVDHLETLRNRFEERKFKLRPDLVQKTEMMSANTRRIEQERKAWLVVGARDKGWAPDQVLRGPERAVLWSLPGAVLIVVFWAYTRFSAGSVRAKEHEAELKRQEREVEELGDFRRRLGPDGRPLVRVEDDADTLASSPPVRARPPSSTSTPRPRTSAGVKKAPTQSRPAVRKRPPPPGEDE
jgi:hypothetical protein